MTPKTIASMILGLKHQLSQLGGREALIAHLVNKSEAKTSLEAYEALYRTRLVFSDTTIELAELLRPGGNDYTKQPIGVPSGAAFKDWPWRALTPEGSQLIRELIRLTAAQVDIDNLADKYAQSEEQREAVLEAADLAASEGAEPDVLERLFQYLVQFYTPKTVVALLIMLLQILIPVYLDEQTEAERARRDTRFQTDLLRVLKSIKQQHQGKATHYATRNLNLRSGPGKEHEIIGRVTNGTIVELVEVADKWAKVIIKDGEGERVGWVFKPLITSLVRKP